MTTEGKTMTGQTMISVDYEHGANASDRFWSHWGAFPPCPDEDAGRGLRQHDSIVLPDGIAAEVLGYAASLPGWQDDDGTCALVSNPVDDWESSPSRAVPGQVYVYQCTGDDEGSWQDLWAVLIARFDGGTTDPEPKPYDTQAEAEAAAREWVAGGGQ